MQGVLPWCGTKNNKNSGGPIGNGVFTFGGSSQSGKLMLCGQIFCNPAQCWANLCSDIQRKNLWYTCTCISADEPVI